MEGKESQEQPKIGLDLFNLSLTSGSVPKCWQKKRVTPLFKKGNTDDPNNYRRISILPVTMKIFEKVVHHQDVDFLDLSNILRSFQSDFRNVSRRYPLLSQRTSAQSSRIQNETNRNHVRE